MGRTFVRATPVGPNRDPLTGQESVQESNRDQVLQAAIQDPRWRTDSDYRERVEGWYRHAVGYDAQQLRLTLSNAIAGGAAYGSEEEMLKDMAKPDYKTDPRFRASVEERTRLFLAAQQMAAERESAQRAAVPSPEDGGPAPFRSAWERNEAFRHPRYAVDPVYRADVAARLAVSAEHLPE